jgi:hypothetical protein
MNEGDKSAARRSVKRRTLFFCVCLTVLLMTAAAGFCQGKEANATLSGPEKAAVEGLQTLAETTANLLNVYMDARVTDMLVCSTTCERLKGALTTPEARADANRVLEEMLKISQAYDAVLLVDKKGVCVASAPAGLAERNFSEDAAFKGAAAGKLTVADFHKSDVVGSLDPKSNGWTVTIAAPIKVGNDVEGVLLSFLKWSRIEQQVNAIKVGATGYVYLLNRENQAIVHPVKGLYGESLAGSKINMPALDEAVRKKVPQFSYQFKNFRTNKVDTKFVGFAYPRGYGNFSGLGWTVGAGVDQSEVLGSQSALFLLLWSMGLLK